MGRVVEQRRGMSANGIQFLGNNYRPGVYMAEIIQEHQKASIKLVKQVQ
jgi:hypothetical protein